MTDKPKEQPFSIAQHLLKTSPDRLIGYREGQLPDGTRYTCHSFKDKEPSEASVSADQAAPAPFPLVLRVADAISQVPLSFAPARYGGGYKLRNPEEMAQAALDACNAEEMREALSLLCEAKDLKEAHGECQAYRDVKERGWAMARSVLAKLSAD